MNTAKDTLHREEVGRFSVLRLDGMQVPVISAIYVGGFPEGVAYSEDSTHIYVENFANKYLSIVS
ncbi:MAG: hypothetical protein KUG82_03575 [Pseudomonadales bacterium]|nr:hypothetical protein [Pseudomonadales bacterium]